MKSKSSLILYCHRESGPRPAANSHTQPWSAV